MIREHRGERQTPAFRDKQRGYNDLLGEFDAWESYLALDAGSDVDTLTARRE